MRYLRRFLERFRAGVRGPQGVPADLIYQYLGGESRGTDFGPQTPEEHAHYQQWLKKRGTANVKSNEATLHAGGNA